MKLRLLQDWVLIEREPHASKSETILLAGDFNKTNVRKGVVLDTGPGTYNKHGSLVPVPVVPGERVAYFRWHHEHRPGKTQMQALYELSVEMGKDIALIRTADILFVIEPGYDVAVDAA